MTTIYFDTNFYIWLCRADERLATDVISNLNQLQVRHVLSDVLIQELLSSADRPERDQVLFERVSIFQIPPYKTQAGLSWEVINQGGILRKEVADIFQAVDKQVTEAESWSLLARKPIGSKKQSAKERERELTEVAMSKLARYGFPENLQDNVQQTMTAALAMVESFLGDTGIELQTEATPENLMILSQKLKELIPPDDLARIEEHSRIVDSATATERDRPYQIAIGQASGDINKRFANTLRDTQHLMVFVMHQEEIDYIQLDSRQQSLILQSKPTHRIVELGLADRCFSMKQIANVVDTVSKLPRRK